MKTGHVYAILAPEVLRVKIGFTSGSAYARLEDMKVGSPCELYLMGIVSGATRKTESSLHAEFADHRYRGEWFHACVMGALANHLQKTDDYYDWHEIWIPFCA